MELKASYDLRCGITCLGARIHSMELKEIVEHVFNNPSLRESIQWN